MGLRRLLLLAAILLAAPLAARAQTPDVKPLGPTPLFSDPSCASDGVGTTVCAAVGRGRAMIVNRFANNAWSGWTALAGHVTSPPSCFQMRGFAVWCVVRDDTDRMVNYVWGPAKWGGPFAIGELIADAPSCVSLNTVTAVCAAHYPGGALTTAYFKAKGIEDAGQWFVLGLEGASIYSPIHCAANAAALGDAYCAWIGDAGQVWIRRFLGQTLQWQPANTPAGGVPFSPPQCNYDNQPPYGSSDPKPLADHMDCYVIGGGDYMWSISNYDYFNYGSNAGPDNWTGWAVISGGVNAIVVQTGGCSSYTSYPPGKPGVPSLGCLFTGDDAGDLLVEDYAGNTFNVGGLYFGTPSCFNIDFSGQPNNLICVIRQINNTAVSLQLH